MVKINAVKFRKFLPIFIMVGLLGSAIYIATQLSSRQGISPNAPGSKPAASCNCKENCNENEKGTGEKCGPANTWNCCISTSPTTPKTSTTTAGSGGKCTTSIVSCANNTLTTKICLKATKTFGSTTTKPCVIGCLNSTACRNTPIKCNNGKGSCTTECYGYTSGDSACSGGLVCCSSDKETTETITITEGSGGKCTTSIVSCANNTLTTKICLKASKTFGQTTTRPCMAGCLNSTACRTTYIKCNNGKGVCSSECTAYSSGDSACSGGLVCCSKSK